MSGIKEKMSFFVGKLVQDAMASGLTWDEAVAAFGVAAKVTAHAASNEGDGSAEECLAHARKRFEEGFAQHMQVVFARADMSQLREHLNDADANALLENCNIRLFMRH